MIECIVDTAVVVPVNFMPLLDDVDFKSIEIAVVYNSAGLVVTWNFVPAATGVMASTAVTPTTAGVYDWSEPLADKGMYAIEIPASGGGTINNDTEGVGWFTGVATGVLPWAGPQILFRPALVVNSLVVGSDALQVHAVEIAANLITATAINADAITAAKLAADVTTELQSGLATPTNITAGVITTVTNLTNAPTAGDLTATMKTSVTTAATAATPIAASVTGAVGSVTGNVGGNVTGTVGSVVGAVGSVTGNVGGNVAGSVGSVVGAVGSVTARVTANADQINGVAAAAVRLALSAGVIIPGTVDTTAFSTTTTEFEADDITTATSDFYNGRVIIFTSGALIGQATSISDYVLTAGRGHFTVVALTNAPANDVTFVVV